MSPKLFRIGTVLMLLLGPVLATFGAVEQDRSRVLAVVYLAILVFPDFARISRRTEIGLQFAIATVLAAIALLQTYPAGWHGPEIAVYSLAAAFAAAGALGDAHYSPVESSVSTA